MAKVLISLVGTGRKSKGERNKNEYERTDYLIDGKLYEYFSFVSNAIVEHHKIEKIYFIGTPQSMWDNICDSFNGDEEYQMELMDKMEKDIKAKDDEKIVEEDLLKLNKIIDKKLKFEGSNGSRCLIVKSGENEEELWEIFDKFISIFESLDNDDEIFFDVTHAFRSLSILTLLMAEFGKINNSFRNSKILYGMLKKDQPSVVLDLSMFFEVLDWAKAIDNLKNNGNSFELRKLIENSNFSKEVTNTFKNYSNALSVSDMGALQQSIKVLKGKMDLFEKADNRMLRLISKDLSQFVNRFNIEKLFKFQLELAIWYSENNNYAMAYISLAEAIISCICEKEGLDPTDRDDREEAKKILREYGDYKLSTKDKQKINKIYFTINRIRNNIAHKISSKNGKGKSSPTDAINNFDKYIKDLRVLLF